MNRLVRRNSMKVEKRQLHALEAEQLKLLEEVRSNTGVDEPWRPVNFHRPVNQVIWNMSKQRYERTMFPVLEKSRASIREDADACYQLKELSFEADDEQDNATISEETKSPPIRIRPGGRLERRMVEKVIEEAWNAAEFSMAICNMQIPYRILLEQKGDDL